MTNNRSFTESRDENGKRIIHTALCGKALLNIPQINKGTAFSEAEREQFKLFGKLPHAVETLQQQVDRAYLQYQRKTTPMAKNVYLNELHSRNTTVFYKLVSQHLAEMLPIVYTPTVGEAVKCYSEEFRKPRGLYIAYPDRHRIREMLRNRTNPDIDIIVTSDAEGVLGIGDQGVGGIYIPVAKLMVYTLCGGIDPNKHLPIYLDVGTNNDALLNDPMYLGWRHKRITGEEYDEMMALFVDAVKAEFPGLFLHWEDFGRDNARRNLERFQDELCTFNDDMQGTAAVTLSALLSASKAAKVTFTDQKIVIFGAGTAGAGIADQIKACMMQQGLSEAEALDRFWLIDRFGLLVDDMESLVDFQKPYARTRADVQAWATDESGAITLAEVVKHVNPTTLIGCSTCHGAFTESIIKDMAAHTDKPIIFPLSNPTPLAEADPNDLLKWTEGKALIATGSPFNDVTYNGEKRTIAQCNNALVFPGLGLGIVATKSRHLTDNMLFAACYSLSEHAPIHGDAKAPLLPPINEAPNVSFDIGVAVAKQAIEDGVAKTPERGIEGEINYIQWQPEYPEMRFEG